MDRKTPPPPPRKLGQVEVTALRSTAPGASAAVIPKRMSAHDIRTLADLGILRSKDGSVEQELEDDPLPANRDIATVEDIGKGQERPFPHRTTTDWRPAPPSQKPDTLPNKRAMDRKTPPPTPPPFSLRRRPPFHELTGYDRHIPPPRNHDKGKTRPFLYSPPEDRVPKHYDPFDTARELEPVQFNVGFVEPGLRSHPPLANRNLADPFSTPTTTTMGSIPPPPHLSPGELKVRAAPFNPRRINPFDALDEEDALKSSGGAVEKDESDEQMGDAPSRPIESKVYNTWEHYLQDLKPAWNGNRRLAIDVPGDGIEFHRHADDTLWPNEVDARLICDLVRGAIEAEVPANGVALTCANFLGVVVYGAQGGVTTEKMFRFCINKPGKRVMIENTHVVEGAEGDIVLLSFARNIPDKPFDVALSRAKQSTLLIGNIRAWCQEKIDENKVITAFGKNAMLTQFGFFIQDIIEQKDGISYGDVQRFLNGEDIMEAEFPKLLKPDRTTVELNDAFGRLQQDSGGENEAEKRVKKTRRSQNAQRRQDWFDGVSGGCGVRDADGSNAMNHNLASPSRKDGKKKAPAAQSAAPGASASRPPLPDNPFEILRILNAFQAADFEYVEPGEVNEDHSMRPLDQGAFYYDAETPELRSRHGASTQVLPVGDIPDDLKFKELTKGEEYDKAFDAITKRYNGVDGLSKGEATHPDNKRVITNKCAAIISFDSEATAATGTTRAAHGPYFGLGLKPGQVMTKPWIKLEYVRHSQHPAIALVLEAEGQNDVTCYFYANSIQRDLEKDEVKFQIHGDNEADVRHEQITEVADLRMSGELVQVEVYPWGPDKVILNDNGIQPAKAIFTGITNARISELIEIADGNHPAEWEAMSPRDKVIVYLHHSRHFSVFRYWPSGGAAPLDSLREWMKAAIWATAKYGFHWFYQLQSNISIDATYFPLKDTTVPRWLAKTMLIEFDHEGKLVKMQPHEWNAFSNGNKRLFRRLRLVLLLSAWLWLVLGDAKK
ncbi:hypothetical protein Q7P35_005614 [Cladosporium inversicolor]